MVTGWSHRSVQCESADSSSMLQYDDRIIGKACWPSRVLGDHYELRLLNPGLDGFCACFGRRCPCPRTGFCLACVVHGILCVQSCNVAFVQCSALGVLCSRPSLWVLWPAFWALHLCVLHIELSTPCVCHFGQCSVLFNPAIFRSFRGCLVSCSSCCICNGILA